MMGSSAGSPQHPGDMGRVAAQRGVWMPQGARPLF